MMRIRSLPTTNVWVFCIAFCPLSLVSTGQSYSRQLDDVALVVMAEIRLKVDETAGPDIQSMRRIHPSDLYRPELGCSAEDFMLADKKPSSFEFLKPVTNILFLAMEPTSCG